MDLYSHDIIGANIPFTPQNSYFSPKQFMMRIFKHMATFKELCSKHPYTPHLNSSIDLLLYLFYPICIHFS